MTIRTLVIDDEPIALDKLAAYVNKVPFLQLAGRCDNAIEALEILSASDIDLIITDINMPDLNGLEFINSLNYRPMVIFTTAYAEYAVESYKVRALDYLLKPYGFADFQRAVNRALDHYTSNHSDDGMSEGVVPGSLFVKVDYRYVRISLDDIRYIKGYGEYLQIFISGQTTPLVTLSSFAAIMSRLTPNFRQIHRSYIVNTDKIKQVERARVVMDSETFLPISDSFRADFQSFLNDRSIGRTGGRN